jgi:hypothetical protein
MVNKTIDTPHIFPVSILHFSGKAVLVIEILFI